jgi:regulatory protein
MRNLEEVYAAAVALLARREHGAKELADKLKQKGYAESDVCVVLLQCQRLELQSDQRYAGALIRTRVRQGYGPERIRYELQQKYIERDVIAAVMAEESIDWVGCASMVLRKKYKYSGSVDLSLYTIRERQKQKQFLHYRGFSHDIIAHIFDQMLEGCDDE